MKKRHYFLTAAISYFVLLIATVPASSITGLLNKNSPITIQGVSGTLWSGKAYSISIDNIQLNRTEWSFNLWKLFTGEVAIDIKTRLLKNDITAEVGTSLIGRFFINNLSAKFSADEVAQLANIPLVQLDGAISLDIEHAQWKQGEAPLATGEIVWTNAAITVADTASLGNISIILSESEQLSLNAEIKNQGGDISIDGTAELAADNNYTVNVELLPAATANNNIKQSLGMFARKQENGSFVLKKSGSINQIL